MKKTLALLMAFVLVMALAACGGGAQTEAPAAPAAEEAAPAAAPEAAAAEVTWEDYLNWLADTIGADSPDPDGFRALLFQASSWEDIDTAAPPWDKIFSEDAFDASTWDEFVAAGGVGTYNEDFQDDAATGSGEPTGEPSGEPAGNP